MGIGRGEAVGGGEHEDEQPAVGPAPDREPRIPRHRSRSRARKDRPPPDAVDGPAATNVGATAAPDDAARAVGTAAVPVANPVVMPTQTLPVAPASIVDSEEHDWLDREAGPVVRPYTLTGGRSRPFTSGLSLLTHIEALYAPEADLVALQPEQRSILSLTRTATSLAELSARLDLPVGVVRVLVGDLVQANLVSTFEAETAIRPPGDDILQAVIDGLRAL